ncbi:MAG: hypothetical protein HND53_00835 [Proteobacteria bacterium]|nr:hypothetical protein [Pseudomonadota bacterium]NOG59018.1 hypothetical protein [Pseudomonadota bacterium]
MHRKNLEAKFRETHDLLIKARHQFAAHSGADKFEEVKIALVLHPNKKHNFAKLYNELRQPDSIISEDDDVSFKKVVKHVQEKVNEKINKVNDKILTEEILPKGAQYWHKKAKKHNYPNLGNAYANAIGIEIIQNAFPNKTIAATFDGS